MREKELRLAMICYGGVSLAIYMHGTLKEVWRLLRASRALAAYEGQTSIQRAHLKAVAPLALSHRLRRDPLDEAGSSARVARVVEDVLG